MTEVWKSIEGYEGLYEVSSLGRVKSLYFNKQRIRKCSKDTNGYPHVGLTKAGICKPFSVHRLVGIAFLSNEGNLPCIDHIDEIKTNNKVENLEWCTYQHNQEHSLAKKSTLVSPDGVVHRIFNMRKFCREHNLHQSAMGDISLGHRITHKGWSLAA